MLTIDRQPPLPELRQFSQQMEAFLVAAADARTVRRPGRVRSYVAATVTAAAVIVAVIVGLAHSQGAGPNPNPSPGPVQLASFEVSSAPGGLVKLTLSPGQLRDPGALRQALAKVSVPALVTVGKICYVPGPRSLVVRLTRLSSRAAAPGAS